MPINKNEITKEMIEKAMQCKTADELIALAKTGGYELTKEEAETYLAELADYELDFAQIEKAAPFIDKNGNPYLEVHHVIWLSRGDKRRSRRKRLWLRKQQFSLT